MPKLKLLCDPAHTILASEIITAAQEKNETEYRRLILVAANEYDAARLIDAFMVILVEALKLACGRYAKASMIELRRDSAQLSELEERLNL